MSRLRMISWNVNGRRAEGVDRQADALLDRHPDVIALQEITASSLARWRERLTAGGLTVHADSSQRLSASASDRDYRRRYFNLLASRWPLEPLPGWTSCSRSAITRHGCTRRSRSSCTSRTSRPDLRAG